MTVRTASGATYPVRVGPGAIGELPDLLAGLAPAHWYAIVSDDRVFALHGEKVLSIVARGAEGSTVTAHPFPAGERHKSRKEWSRLTDALLEAGVGRDGCVLALGGGVTGDLAGFVAASYMRGIPVVQIPTSIVAMVDSSVGGKTGVDVPMGKNLVGAFHPPRFVLADTELASTLPRAERSQGLAEAVKHGAIMDAGYFSWVVDSATELLEGDASATARLVRRSVEIKADVVSQDEKEAGLRQILNFGHTLGHAIEAAAGFRLPHGSSISIGMVLEARLGEALGVTRQGVSGELEAALRAVELPVEVGELSDDLREGVGPDRVVDLLSRDKKGRGGEPRFVLLSEIGVVDPGEGWSHAVDAEAVRQVLRPA